LAFPRGEFTRVIQIFIGDNIADKNIRRVFAGQNFYFSQGENLFFQGKIDCVFLINFNEYGLFFKSNGRNIECYAGL
jgi:hypothetical protein